MGSTGVTRAACVAISALIVAACDPAPRWERAHDGLAEGLLSVWGRSSTEVYAVGSDRGEGPAVLRYDGARWTRLATGVSGDLWWVTGTDDTLFLGGDGGLILRYDGATFERMDTPGTGTVFGLWAASDDDVWAVGGFAASAGFAWHYDGIAWAAVELPGLEDRGLFKVWGRSSDDVWLVGARGAMYHWDGSAMSLVDAGTTRTLFTVHVRGDRGAAVGGSGTAALVEREGAAWVDRSPDFTPSLFGVWLTDEGGWAVGTSGTVLRRGPDGWVDEDHALGFVQALHAVWVDETGSVWAVGGQVIASPLSDGVLFHRGTRSVAGAIQEGL